MDVKQREYFLDILRVAATCAVVLLHTVTGVMDTVDMSPYPLEKRVFLIVLDLICWCVPIFVLISGYLFLNPAREVRFRDMVTKYCRRIVLALFLFGVPFACLEQIATERTFRIGMVGEGFLMVLRGESWSHMWYLYLILLLYLLTPAIRRLLSVLPRPGVYVLLTALLLGSSILPFLKKLFELENLAVLPDGGIYFFYYICGYLFATSDRKRKLPRWVLPAALVVLAAGMIASRLTGDYTVQMAYNYPFTVLAALLLFEWGLCSEIKSGQKSTAFWQQTAALSFTIYLIHPVFLNLAYKFFHITPLDFSLGISLPVFFFTVLALAAAGAWLLRKLPVLRRYVL